MFHQNMRENQKKKIKKSVKQSAQFRVSVKGSPRMRSRHFTLEQEIESSAREVSGENVISDIQHDREFTKLKKKNKKTAMRKQTIQKNFRKKTKSL